MTIYLNKKDMATSLRISVQAFDKWGVEPVMREGREVLYDVRSVLDNRLVHNNEAKKTDEESDQLDEEIKVERLRLLKAQADEQERENARAEAFLVDTAFCTFVLSRVASEIASILDTIPLAYQRKFPGLSKNHVNYLHEEIIKARNRAAKVEGIIPKLLNEYIEGTVN